MGRRLQTQLLTLPTNLYSSVQIRSPDRRKKRKLVSIEPTAQLRQASQSKLNELPTLEPGGQVWIGDKDRYGRVTGKTEKHRSYFVTSYRKGHTPTKPLCLISRSKTRCSREQHPVLPACDVNPASPVPFIPVLLVRSTPSRPETKKVPLSPQTAAPVATLRTTLVEYIPPRYALTLG